RHLLPLWSVCRIKNGRGACRASAMHRILFDLAPNRLAGLNLDAAAAGALQRHADRQDASLQLGLGPVRVDLLRQADGARRAPVAELADVPVLAFLLMLLLPVRGNGEDVVADIDVDIILAHTRHRRLDDE